MDILFFTHSIWLNSTIKSTHRIPFQFKNCCTAYNLLCYTFPHNPKAKGFPNYRLLNSVRQLIHASFLVEAIKGILMVQSSSPSTASLANLIANIKSTIISVSHQLCPDLNPRQEHVLTFQYLISNLCLNCFKYFFQHFLLEEASSFCHCKKHWFCWSARTGIIFKWVSQIQSTSTPQEKCFLSLYTASTLIQAIFTNTLSSCSHLLIRIVIVKTPVIIYLLLWWFSCTHT